MFVPLQCLKCKAPLEARHFNAGHPEACRFCGEMVECHVYPAIVRELEPSVAGDDVEGDEDAVCFYHEGKRAHIPCDRCGRFLCKLCDVGFSNQHICPACLKRQVTVEVPRQFIPDIVAWDTVASSILAFSIVICGYPSIIGAPLALFLVLLSSKYGEQPAVPRKRLTQWIVVFVSVAVITGWLTLLGYLSYSYLREINH